MNTACKYFLSLFLPWTIVLSAFFSYFYLSNVAKVDTVRTESERLNVDMGKRAINQELKEVVSDLFVLVKNHAFDNDNRTLSPAGRKDLAHDFLVFSKMKGMYDQIRFLDTDGMEVVRVNYSKGKGSRVTDKLLQNKRDQYYFKKSLNIAREKVYVSPLDLNIEHGQIEKPYKPMIRFGTPVFNGKGEKIGVVLLNYLARQLLGDFTRAVGKIQGHVMIVNSDGYWLRHPDPDMEWGFMLDHKYNFIAEYPKSWKKILASDHGQFTDADGMFTFTTISVLHAIQQKRQRNAAEEGHLTGNDYQWKIVSCVSQGIIRAGNNTILLTLVEIAGPLFLLLILVSWRLSQAKMKNKRAEAELYRAAAVFEAASEGIIITDAAGIIETVNSSFTAITGYSKEVVIGNTPAILKSGRYGKEFYQKMWEKLLSSHRWEGEVLNRRQDGTIYTEWLSIVTLVDKQGTICNFVALFSDITLKKKNEEILRKQATIDALTGLPNRQLFLDRLLRAILNSKRLGTRFALFFIDLDKFKIVNDTLGHAAGDQLLKEVAQRIQDVVRESDTVARIGGDEFTVILNNVKENEDASRVAQLIIEVVSESFLLLGQEITIGASIGIALFPDDGVDQTSLINNADSAMYKAKQGGLNGYSFLHANEGDEK